MPDFENGPHRDPNAETAHYQQMQEEADQEAHARAREWEWDLAHDARQEAEHELEAGG